MRSRTLAGYGLCGAFVGILCLVATLVNDTRAEGNWRLRKCNDSGYDESSGAGNGYWTWVRSPEEEKRHVIGLFNRYCIRCHGVDGRGVWDIPDVPNFTNARWQESRTDAQIARIIIDGRGAVMPPFRRVINIEEAWALAGYIRTYAQVAESRPDFGSGTKTQQLPIPMIPPAGDSKFK
jgi:mono/diheme cytochrome c family protein